MHRTPAWEPVTEKFWYRILYLKSRSCHEESIKIDVAQSISWVLLWFFVLFWLLSLEVMLRLTLLSLTFHNTFVLTNLHAPTFLSKTRFPPGHGHTCNSSTGPMGAWGPGVQGHPQLGDEGSLDYIRSCFKRKEQRKRNRQINYSIKSELDRGTVL